MKKLILLIALLILSTPAFADVSVSVTNAWARPTLNGPLVSAVYLDIKNTGKTPVELTSVTSSAGTASLHESMQQNGMVHMQSLESVKIAPGDTVAFAPGHKHIMLDDLKSPLKAGNKIRLTLGFKQGSTTVDVPVSDKAPTTATMPAGMTMDHH